MGPPFPLPLGAGGARRRAWVPQIQGGPSSSNTGRQQPWDPWRGIWDSSRTVPSGSKLKPTGPTGVLGGLLNHFVRPQQHRRGDREAEGLGGLHVDHQLEPRGLLDGEAAGFGALEYPVHIEGGTVELFRQVRSVAQQSSGLREFSVLGGGRQPLRCRQV
jgi:hypothetical protein